MKKLLLSIASAGVMLFSIAGAHADTKEGPYVSATGSFVFANDLKKKEKVFGEDLKKEYELKNSFGGSLAVGYIVDQWRVELEGLYRKNKFNKEKASGSATPANNGTFDYKGHSRNFALMANVYYDIPLDCNFSAYVGAGLGVAFNEIKLTQIDGIDAAYLKKINKTNSTLFAWQLMGGLQYEITENVTAFAGYRLFATGKPSYKTFDDAGKAVTRKFNKAPFSHSIDLGIRYSF